MKRQSTLLQMNRKLAAEIWGKLPHILLVSLRDLTIAYGFSLGRGDLACFDGRWYVTHAGLLRLASRRRCTGIQVEAISRFCDSEVGRWIFKATVSIANKPGAFVGYGDADPANVSPLVRGAEMRVAETRAVNRALRKAYGIGICSVEELGVVGGAGEKSGEARRRSPQPSNRNSWDSGPRLRDRLCQLIRQHQLDPDLVKAYAVDFCGTETLKEATRAQVEAFVERLADWAEKDRNALLCQLNSYFRVKETQESPKAQQDGAA